MFGNGFVKQHGALMNDAPPTPYGTQMWVPNWKQRKDKESKCVPWLAAL
jgi:hypothetical protein